MSTLHEWAAVMAAVALAGAALAFSALRVRTTNALTDDAKIAWAPRVAASASILVLASVLAWFAPLTLPEAWRSVGIALAVVTTIAPCCVYVLSLARRRWLLAIPIAVIAIEASLGALGLPLAGAVLAIGAVLPILVVLVHSSATKRIPGGGSGVYGGGGEEQ